MNRRLPVLPIMEPKAASKNIGMFTREKALHLEFKRFGYGKVEQYFSLPRYDQECTPSYFEVPYIAMTAVHQPYDARSNTINAYSQISCYHLPNKRPMSLHPRNSEVLGYAVHNRNARPNKGK